MPVRPRDCLGANLAPRIFVVLFRGVNVREGLGVPWSGRSSYVRLTSCR